MDHGILDELDDFQEIHVEHYSVLISEIRYFNSFKNEDCGDVG
jgi:hypothetical protein